MTTWILLLLITFSGPDSPVGFQIDGFESEAACSRAAAQAKHIAPALASARAVCIERKASR